MKLSKWLLPLLLSITTSNVVAEENPLEPVRLQEFTTQQTVIFALRCMSELGGQTDANLYTCVCRHDAIEERVSFSDFEDAEKFESYKKMPGEKGGLFRENELGEIIIERVKKAVDEANSQCPVVKTINANKHKEENPK